MKAQRKNAISQISSLREQVEDLHDYLDVLEARAQNKGKRTYSTDDVRKQLGHVGKTREIKPSLREFEAMLATEEKVNA